MTCERCCGEGGLLIRKSLRVSLLVIVEACVWLSLTSIWPQNLASLVWVYSALDPFLIYKTWMRALATHMYKNTRTHTQKQLRYSHGGCVYTL